MGREEEVFLGFGGSHGYFGGFGGVFLEERGYEEEEEEEEKEKRGLKGEERVFLGEKRRE